MPEAPTGTITFLFTDVEGSTRLWQEHPESMRVALAQHDQLLRDAIDANGGYVFSTGGDSFAAAFSEPLDAVLAALDAQRALRESDWGKLGTIHVRMALDTGLAEHRDGDYFGPPLNRAARIEELARGGNILLSNTTADLVRYSLPDGVSLEQFGEHKLRDVERRVQLFRLQTEAAPAGRRGLLLGGLAASGAVVAIVVIAAVILAVRSPSVSQPPDSSDQDLGALESQVSEAWSVDVPGTTSKPLIIGGAIAVVSSDESSSTLIGSTR